MMYYIVAIVLFLLLIIYTIRLSNRDVKRMVYFTYRCWVLEDMIRKGVDKEYIIKTIYRLNDMAAGTVQRNRVVTLAKFVEFKYGVNLLNNDTHKRIRN